MTPSPVGYHGSFVDVDGNDRSQAFRLRGTSALFQRAKSLYATLPRALAPGGRALPPHVYYFEVTRACNLRCQMCQYIDFLENVPVKEQRVGELTTDEWLDVIAQIEPASLVIFSGGELFVRPDMMTILDAATKRARVHFITNGTMLDDARVAELERRFAPRLGRKGINIVSISIDGPPAAHDLIRRKPGGFARTAEGIGRLHAARAGRARRVPMLTTTTVIQPDNVDTLAELPALLAELDIDIMNLATETRVQDLADFGKRAPRDIETSEITWASIERGRLDEALDRTMAAADAAGCGDFADAHWDRDVGERGLQLSGGQQQRVALARVLLRDTPIVVLDEFAARCFSKFGRTPRQHRFFKYSHANGRLILC